MHKFSNFIVLLIIFAFSNTSYSADLLDIYKRALEHNNEYKIIKNDYKISKEKYNQTFSSIFPDISLNAATNKTEIHRYIGAGTTDDFSSQTYSVQVKQPVFRLAFFDERKKSSFVVKKSNVNVFEKSDSLIIESINLYFNLINTNNLIHEAEISRQLASKVYESSKKLFTRGMITDKIFNKNKNNYDIAVLNHEIAVNSFETAKHDIFVFAGKEINDVHKLDTEVDIKIKQYKLENILKLALNDSNQIKSAKYDVSINRNDLKSNRSQHFPTVDLIASYDYTDTTSGTRFGANKRESSTIGLSLNFPIYQGGSQSSKVRESRYRFSNAKLTLDNMTRKIRKDVHEKYYEHIASQKMMTISKNKYHAANINFEAANKGYDNGIYTDVDLLSSKLEYVESQNDYTRAAFDYILIDLQLKKHMSTLSEKDIVAVNSMLIW